MVRVFFFIFFIGMNELVWKLVFMWGWRCYFVNRSFPFTIIVWGHNYIGFSLLGWF